MTGSEKQIQWAEKIQASFLGQLSNYELTLDSFLQDGFDKNDIAATNIPAAKKMINILRTNLHNQTSAKFYIECVQNWKLDVFDFEQTNFGNIDKFAKRIMSFLAYIEKGKPAPTKITLDQFLTSNDIVINRGWYV